MTRRHPAEPPRLWLMTDERMGDGLWRALQRLPRGSGVVFRHYDTPAAERRRLFRRVAAVARARGLVLVRAGDGPLGGGEAGTHGRRGRGLVTWPAHDRAEALRGMRAGADLLFVSPVFVTRSHAGAAALGPAAARRIAAGLPIYAIALGGVTLKRGRALMRTGWRGWAAIDAWMVASPATGESNIATAFARQGELSMNEPQMPLGVVKSHALRGRAKLRALLAEGREPNDREQLS